MRNSHGAFKRHAGKLQGAEARRNAEAVADVALAIAEHLVVDGENQRIVIRFLRALGQFAGEAAILEDEDLHPARRDAGLPPDPRWCRPNHG